jgi:hypothetical protein
LVLLWCLMLLVLVLLLLFLLVSSVVLCVGSCWYCALLMHVVCVVVVVFVASWTCFNFLFSSEFLSFSVFFRQQNMTFLLAKIDCN